MYKFLYPSGKMKWVTDTDVKKKGGPGKFGAAYIYFDDKHGDAVEEWLERQSSCSDWP